MGISGFSRSEKRTIVWCLQKCRVITGYVPALSLVTICTEKEKSILKNA